MQQRSLLFGLLALSACADVAPTDGPRTEASGKLSSNGLVLNAQTLSRLSADPLSDSPAAIDLAATEDGRVLLEYVAQCALEEDATLQVGDLTLYGALGLAPGWRDDRCDDGCQRWVSACLLAHANAGGTSVPIWLRADHPAIGAAPDDSAGYTYQEAAFYGDVFAADGEAPALHACVGRGPLGDLDTGETVQILDESVEEYFHHRMCILEDQCGIEPTGLCGDYPQMGVRACERDAGDLGAFGRCHTSDLARDGVPSGEAFDEVITVYLVP